MNAVNPYTPGVRPPQAAGAERQLRRRLFFTGNVLGFGFLGYLLLSRCFGLLLRDGAPLGALYNEVPLYTYLIEILYSFFCVGLPFLIVFIILRKSRAYSDLTIPLGGTYASSHAALLVPAAVGVCFVGSLLSNYFSAWADAMGFGFTSYYQALEPDVLPPGVLGAAALVLRTAVVPAIIEELVFRGVVLQTLRRYGDRFALVSSAVLFGLMHANMTQAPFAVVAGIALGYCALVTGSLRTGIAVHFINNLVSIISVFLLHFSGEEGAGMISNVIVYASIAVGFVCLAFYAKLNPDFLRLRPGRWGRIRKKRRCLFLAPVLLIAILWLLWYTVLDIEVIASWVTGG